MGAPDDARPLARRAGGDRGRHVRGAAADDAEALAALADLEQEGPRSAMARAIVFDLARRLAADEEGGRSVWKEAIERGDAVVPDWN